jgi:hypothetical protein
VQDVNNVDPLGGLAEDAIENLVVAVNPMPHASIFVAWYERESEGHTCEAQALVSRLAKGAHGAAWIVAGTVNADGLKLGLSGGQDADDHALPFAIA